MPRCFVISRNNFDSLADHSHYEKAIEQLKKAAAQAEQDTYGDDSMGMTGEEEAEDLTTEVNVLLLLSDAYCHLMLFYMFGSTLTI